MRKNFLISDKSGQGAASDTLLLFSYNLYYSREDVLRGVTILNKLRLRSGFRKTSVQRDKLS